MEELVAKESAPGGTGALSELTLEVDGTA